MKLTISREDLQKRKLFVASPMYGGQCFGLYTKSLIQLCRVMFKNQLSMEFSALFNESLITRARNELVNQFLQTDMTHMLCIDADIEFTPDDALALLVLADPDSDKDVVCGLYPKKHICWSKVAAAVEKGIEPEKLDNFVGQMVFNPTGLSGDYALDEPLEVTECGTGFMMVQRHVFEQFEQAYPELSYAYELGGRRTCYFDTAIDPESGRYLSEDYNFCRLIRALGFKVWMVPWINLNHCGHYVFKGNPAAVSSVYPAEVKAQTA